MFKLVTIHLWCSGINRWKLCDFLALTETERWILESPEAKASKINMKINSREKTESIRPLFSEQTHQGGTNVYISKRLILVTVKKCPRRQKWNIRIESESLYQATVRRTEAGVKWLPAGGFRCEPAGTKI